MAGFSSRLREKIESTRSNAATGHGPHNNQPKNIRGLTRLGANAVGATAPPSGGLLAGHSNSVGGSSTAGNSVPLPIQTPSLRKENGGHGISASAVPLPSSLRSGPILGSSRGTPATAARLESSAPLLGESKIAPGWGAKSANDAKSAPSGHLGGIKPSNDTKSAPSGHLGGLKPRDHLAPRKMDARRGEDPSSPPAARSHVSLSRRSRWGDEEEESEEGFPQIGAKTLPKIGANDRGLSRDDNHGENRHTSHGTNGARWGVLESPHSLAAGGGASGGSISHSHGLDNGDGSKHHGSRQLQHSRVGGEGFDTKGVRHGHEGKGDHHPQFSQSRTSDDVKRREVIAGSTGNLTHPKLNPSRDPDSTRYRGSSDASHSRTGSRSLYQRFIGDDSARCVSDEPTQSTPMVLLRSNEAGHSGQTKKVEHLAGPSDASHATVHESTEATQPSQLGRPVPNSSPQPPHASKSVVPSLMSTRSPSPILEEESQEGTPDLTVATKHPHQSSSDCDPQAARHTVPDHGRENTKKDKKDLAIEQQQKVLRQVAERRAAATATMKGKSLLDKSNGDKSNGDKSHGDKSNGVMWERGRQVPTNVEDGIEAESLEIEPGQCHKEGADPDRSESPDKPKQKAHRKLAEKTKGERRNPCKIDGHEHDWNDCPNNPKSECFVRNNPCRIDGHEHDWNDCPDNPKSDNHVSPINRKGRKGPTPSCVNGKIGKCRLTVSSPTIDDESSNICKIVNSEKVIKDTIPAKGESEDGATKTKEGSTKNEANSTPPVSQELPVRVDSNNKSTHAKPFVPAPPPTVSAWTSPAPPEILSATLSPTPETIRGGERRTQPSFQSTPHQLPKQLKEPETEAFTVSLPNDAHRNESPPANQNNTPVPFSKSPRVLLPANNALFGRTPESTAAYGSWNLPPTVVPSLCVVHFGLNLFTRTTATASPEEQFASIWSDCAPSLGTSRSNPTKRNFSKAKKKTEKKTEKKNSVRKSGRKK